MSITKEKKNDAIQDFQRGGEDTGSPEVQIAILTNRINNLTEHMKKHTKDYATRRGLLAMVSRRRRLLDYLKRHDPQKYLDMLARLGIRKQQIAASVWSKEARTQQLDEPLKLLAMELA